jgi:hypothetical protein
VLRVSSGLRKSSPNNSAWIDGLSPKFFKRAWVYPTGIHKAHVFCSRSILGDSAPYAEDKLWDFYCEYGGTPRALIDYALDPTDYKAKVAEQIQASSPNVLWDAMTSTYLDERFDLVVAVESGGGSHATRTHTIAAKPVFQMFWDRHLADEPFDVALRFFNLVNRGAN